MHVKNKPTTQIQGRHSVFDALIDLENKASQNSSETDTTNIMLDQLMQFGKVDQEFGKLHLLIDKLTESDLFKGNSN